MIIGLILFGSLIGAIAALIAFVLGQGVLVALLIYLGVGSVCTLVLALRMALRHDPEPDTEI